MKKLVCIALFSFAINANANEKKEILANKDEEKIVSNNLLEINVEFTTETSDDEMFFDCGSDGDIHYQELIMAGESHREARSSRRDFVRDCRGGTWAWLGFCAGFIGHCDQ